MITKNDTILLLTELQNKGIDVTKQLRTVVSSTDVSIDVLKFINDNRQLDVNEFYNNLRVAYNKKKSKLYINIMKEIDDPQEVLTTLSALLTQILLYSKKLTNKKLFISHVRATEITTTLNNYFNNFNINTAISLLRLIKIDIRALESLN